MFFYLGDECPVQGLTKVDNNLYLDKGWNETNGVWYKGYSTECVLSQSLDDILAGYQPEGKWCVIHEGILYHPKYRGFPLNTDGKSLTDLKLPNYETVVFETPHFTVGTTLTLDEVAEKVGDILIENISNFYKFNDVDNLDLIVSAGLDTITCWALIDQVTDNYTLNLYVPTGSETSVLEGLGCRRDYSNQLIEQVGKDYWGYYYLSVSNDTVWSLGGYYAEVMQYRDTLAINALANYKGKLIDELANDTDYLYWFLKRPSVEEFKKSKLQFDSDIDVKKYLFDTVFYDFQMWHLDNNMYFSPFYDHRIPNEVLRLSIEDLTLNSVTGEIQRRIIKKFKPELLSLVSDFKNEREMWDNFKNNFDTNVHVNPKAKLFYR